MYTYKYVTVLYLLSSDEILLVALALAVDVVVLLVYSNCRRVF